MTVDSAATIDSGVIIRRLGIEPYEKVWRDMLAFTLERTAESPDELWVLQHEPVFTLGQAGKEEHVLNAGGIPVVRCDRGGQVTYHGPGQLVIYILSDLRRSKTGARALVDAIERSIIRVLAEYDIDGLTRSRAPGVYVDDRKIAALGLRIKNGCSYHGLSFNVDMDLTPFTSINPCGYTGLETTQLRELVPGSGDGLFADAAGRLERELLRNLL